jgi:hypothetical protein
VKARPSAASCSNCARLTRLEEIHYNDADWHHRPALQDGLRLINDVNDYVRVI